MLLPVTYYDQQLRELLILDKQSQLIFGEVVTLENNWSGQIHMKRGINNSSILINLLKEEE